MLKELLINGDKIEKPGFHTGYMFQRDNLFECVNPNSKSKPAPRSEDINTREVNEDIENFFNSFK